MALIKDQSSISRKITFQSKQNKLVLLWQLQGAAKVKAIITNHMSNNDARVLRVQVYQSENIRECIILDDENNYFL